MRRREQKILDRLKQRAALVRPAFLRSFGVEPHELGCSQETCPACDGSGTVFRLRPDPPTAAHAGRAAVVWTR